MEQVNTAWAATKIGCVAFFNASSKLHVAVEFNNKKAVAFFLNQGENPNTADNHKKTPFNIACENGYVEVARLILEHTGKKAHHPFEGPQQKDLQAAVKSGSLELVNLLLTEYNLIANVAILHVAGESGNQAVKDRIFEAWQEGFAMPASSAVDSEPGNTVRQRRR